MKIVTISATAGDTEYKDRVWLSDEASAEAFKEAWLSLLEKKTGAGTDEVRKVIFSVASLEADEEDTPLHERLNEALNRRDN